MHVVNLGHSEEEAVLSVLTPQPLLILVLVRSAATEWACDAGPYHWVVLLYAFLGRGESDQPGSEASISS